MASARISISVSERLAAQVREMRRTGELDETVSAICQRALRRAVADALAAPRVEHESEQEEA